MQAQPVSSMDLVDSTSIVLSDLVSATEVYLPIFIAGVVLAFSGFGSAMVLGSLIDDDNVDEVRHMITAFSIIHMISHKQFACHSAL